ncbi:MAG: dockerin type I domain-containing protein [Ruminococcus sp.]|jgi:hypothetical protein|nr:dockerin type I domain-containing protein [Ruminococcus sp.]
MKKRKNMILRKLFMFCLSFVILISTATASPQKIAADLISATDEPAGWAEVADEPADLNETADEPTGWAALDSITGEYLLGDEYKIDDDFINSADTKLMYMALDVPVLYAQGTQDGIPLKNFDASYIDVHNFAGRWDSYWSNLLTAVKVGSLTKYSIPLTFTNENDTKIQIADALLSFMMKDGTYSVVGDNAGYMLNFYDPAGKKTGIEIGEYFEFDLLYSCFPHYHYMYYSYYADPGMPVQIVIAQTRDISGSMHWIEEKEVVTELVGTLGSTPEEIRKNANDYLCERCYYNSPNDPGAADYHNGQRAYCALVEGDPVCNGYALAYALLCMSNGVDMRYVSGQAGGLHAWNLFYKEETPSDRTLYLTDVTWNDPGGYYPETGEYTNNPNLNHFEKPWSTYGQRTLSLGDSLIDLWFAHLDMIDSVYAKPFEPEPVHDFSGHSIDYTNETIIVPLGVKYSMTDTEPSNWTTAPNGTGARVSLQLPNNSETAFRWFYKNGSTGIKTLKRPDIEHLTDTNIERREITVENAAGYEYSIVDRGSSPQTWTEFTLPYQLIDYSSSKTVYYRKKATSSAFASPYAILADYAIVDPGDADADGKVTNMDVTRLKQYSAGWPVDIYIMGADADGDGIITNQDVTILKQYNAGWNVKLGK